MASSRFLPALLGSLVLAAPACVGNIGDRGNDGSSKVPGADGAHPGLDVAPAGLRRLTPAQYLNSARDLLGDAQLELDLDPDTGQAVTLLGAEKLNAAADFIVSRSDAWTKEIFPCDTSGEGTSACVDEFIATFGRRAFRHPLKDKEIAWLRGVFDQARTEQTFKDSLLIVLRVMLQSPQFVYFLERGGDATAGLPDGVRPLTGWERASRLSYFLWNTTPDDELLAAAESGALDTVDGVEAQAERLLGDARVHTTVKDFFIDWLELNGAPSHPGLDEGTKNPDLYPEDSPALRVAMRKEVEALIDRVVFEDKGTLDKLVTTTDAYVNASLAKLYGVAGPSDDATFEWVMLPADQRAGLFTRAAFLTTYAGTSVKSPIRRGAYLVKKAMCIALGKPPPNAADVPVMGGTVDGTHKTVRQDVESKTSTGVCVGCHSIINPAGFAFENFDALGKWQTKETGTDDAGPFSLPIDASGSIPVFDEDGVMASGTVAVQGPVEMSKALAETPGVRACLSTRWFATALHRVPADQDQTTVDALNETLASGATIHDVVSTMVHSDAFLFLRQSKE